MTARIQKTSATLSSLIVFVVALVSWLYVPLASAQTITSAATQGGTVEVKVQQTNTPQTGLPQVGDTVTLDPGESISFTGSDGSTITINNPTNGPVSFQVPAVANWKAFALAQIVNGLAVSGRTGGGEFFASANAGAATFGSGVGSTAVGAAPTAGGSGSSASTFTSTR